MSLIDELEKEKRLPMHMPGHKRNTELAPYLARLAADIDITEIDGFDNLHAAEGILKRSMEKCAALRGADRAFYLTNGATGGILAAVNAVVGEGESVICARNCHKSVYNALELSGADVRFILPRADKFTGACGEIDPAEVRAALLERAARLVIITSPTYEGVVSDVAEICRAAHDMGVPVLVDAAHGAHFGFGGGFPESAAECGADISVESLHKTLLSLTQTAVCYVRGGLVSPEKIAEELAVFESSSPSYLLMASIDGCVRLLSERRGELFDRWQSNLDYFYERTKGLEHLKLLGKGDGFFGFDRSKIVILGDGRQISAGLREHGIEPELTSLFYTVAMTGAGDTRESLGRLAEALLELDKKAAGCVRHEVIYPPLPERVMPPRAARRQKSRPVAYAEAAGCMAAEYIFAYPPGIPLIIPGERISPEAAAVFGRYEAGGIELLGGAGHIPGKILVSDS